MEYVVIIAAVGVLILVGALAFVVPKLRRPPTAPPKPKEPAAQAPTTTAPTQGTQAPPAEGAPTVEVPPTPETAAPPIETPEPTAGRLVRLRTRLSRSQNLLGRGLLAVLSRDRLDDEAWEEIEETLLTADVGVEPTMEIVSRLRERTKVLGTRSPEELRALLTEELESALRLDADRSLAATGHDGRPAVVLVVGVNGSGKTTTCGKIARVLVADGHQVLLGAADTFRAAAADQLQTWGRRVGSPVVRGPEGGDPASVAFDAVKRGTDEGVDTVLVDTAGRLQNKAGLMDELGKVKRVIEKQGPVDETLLVLDATTGQNGLEQAR
ncbi:MAG: signal recognition particle receptor subunit alpha, partial [Stackebrandtia sp.]